jgi:hypothetical protein
MGARGREIVARDFSWARLVQTQIALYDELLRFMVDHHRRLKIRAPSAVRPTQSLMRFVRVASTCWPNRWSM